MSTTKSNKLYAISSKFLKSGRHTTRLYLDFPEISHRPNDLDRSMYPSATSGMLTQAFHTSSRRFGLEEFFDLENVEEVVIKCGRPWKLEELRLKSNEDLHKLWYVFLKEYNRLLTMEHEYKELCESMPSPERIEKVEEGIDNLLEVVAERNRAYNLLETGTSGEPQPYLATSVLGEKYMRKPKEYPMPMYMTKYFKLKQKTLGPWIHHFIKLKEEKDHKRISYRKAIKKKEKERLRKAFPDANIE